MECADYFENHFHIHMTALAKIERTMQVMMGKWNWKFSDL